MLYLNSKTGFAPITRQIRGGFTAPQFSNLHIGLSYRVSLIYSPHRPLTVSSSERGVSPDLLEYLAQTYLETPQFPFNLSDAVYLRWFR